MIRFVNEHRDRFGVELICRVLRPAVQGFLTSRGYRAAVGREPSARQLRDDHAVTLVARAPDHAITGDQGRQVGAQVAALHLAGQLAFQYLCGLAQT